MKNLLVAFCFIIIGISCSIRSAVDDQETSTSTNTTGGGYGLYPNVISYNKNEEENEDPWVCGYEVIESIGPQGEIFLIEVQLPCDPMADVYKGCPPESLEKQ